MATLTITKSPKSIANLADQLKALGDQTRMEIMISVAASENQESCVCDLTPGTGLSQGTVSHHLKLLQDAGLLDREQRGKWAYFSITETGNQLMKALGIIKK
jgi:ArsR family transcriptional regulator, arsenate/arsenite/antimonite-responsive transcriptional repressor